MAAVLKLSAMDLVHVKTLVEGLFMDVAPEAILFPWLLMFDDY